MTEHIASRTNLWKLFWIQIIKLQIERIFLAREYWFKICFGCKFKVFKLLISFKIYIIWIIVGASERRQQSNHSLCERWLNLKFHFFPNCTNIVAPNSWSCINCIILKTANFIFSHNAFENIWPTIFHQQKMHHHKFHFGVKKEKNQLITFNCTSENDIH